MDDIPGSKPRKLIRRQNFSNPSLISYSIKPLFDPLQKEAVTERNHLRQMQKLGGFNGQNNRSHNRTKSQISFGFDSLQQASQEFIKKKNSVILPPTNIITHINRPNIQQAIEQKLKLSGYQQVAKNINIQNSARFNFIRSDSIKAKQKHGYDIINGMNQM